MQNYADMMFHDAVAELQKADGSFEMLETSYRHRTLSKLGLDEIEFIQSRESIYMASMTPDGWPYVQHRGGPRGFLRVTGPSRIACADYKGNRQFVSMGNVSENNRVSLFCMDYMRRARLKIQGHATLTTLEDADPEVVAQLALEGTPAERVLVVDIQALDWNCPKYIPTLYSEEAIVQVIGGQLGKLQAENEALKAELAALKRL